MLLMCARLRTFRCDGGMEGLGNLPCQSSARLMAKAGSRLGPEYDKGKGTGVHDSYSMLD